MPYKMDSSGNWTFVESSSSNSKKDSGGKTSENKKVTNTTSDTKKSLTEISDNETESLKYAEEASFTMVGDNSVKRGGHLKVTGGVAERWMRGNWLVLETTHTIDLKGYKTEGRLGRIPYKDESSKSSSSKSSGGSTNSSSDTSKKNNKKNSKKNTDASKSDKSGSKWKMDSSGKWTKTSK